MHTIFIKTLMDRLTTPTSKTKFGKQRQIFLNIWTVESVIRWVYYDFKYKSVYFYPNLKLLWKEP